MWFSRGGSLTARMMYQSGLSPISTLASRRMRDTVSIALAPCKPAARSQCLRNFRHNQRAGVSSKLSCNVSALLLSLSAFSNLPSPSAALARSRARSASSLFIVMTGTCDAEGAGPSLARQDRDVDYGRRASLAVITRSRLQGSSTGMMKQKSTTCSVVDATASCASGSLG